MRVRMRVAYATAAIVAAAAANPAHAGLGQSLASAPADGQVIVGVPRMAAKVASAAAQAGVRTQTVQTSQGDTVVEYADANGIVFAITWRGPFRPDLSQLLGAYFGAYEQATHVAQGLTVATSEGSGIVVHSRGKMRSFEGVAWVPALVPAGFDPSELSP